MRDTYNGMALTDALRAAVNLLRDSVEAGRMPSGEALTSGALDAHSGAADLLEQLLHDTTAAASKLTPP